MVVKISVCVFLRMFVFQWQKHKTENSLFLRLLEGAMLISHQAFAGVHERNHPGLNYISWEVLWLSTQFPKLFRRLLPFILRKDDIQQQIFTSSWIYRPKCWQDHSGSEFYGRILPWVSGFCFFSQQPLAPQAWKDAEQEALLPSARGYPPLPGHHFAPVCPCLFFSPKDYSRIRLENPFLPCMSSLSNYFP